MNEEPGIKPLFSRPYTHLVIGLLLLTYIVNFVDRTIIATLAEAIKVDLKITDRQVGLLQGFAFVVLYTIAGLPIARLAERRNRVSIISVCLCLWSGLTMLCGAAQTYMQLLLTRVGVGVGEAGCTPPSHSLISDYVPAERRATALSIYSLGVPLGTMVGVVSGGLIVQYLSWREAFFIVGLPGILLAIIIKLVIKEPPRGYSETLGGTSTSMSSAAPAKSLWAVAAFMSRQRAVVHFTVAITLTSFAIGGVFSFSQPYFIRTFGLSYAEVAVVFGLAGGVSQGLSTVIAGMLADAGAKRDARWYGFIPALGLAVATPLYMIMFNVNSWPMAIGFLLVGGCFLNFYIAPTFGALYRIITPQMRATAAAIVLFSINFGGLGPGPFIAGWITDLFSTHLFAQAGFGEFISVCPGGRAAAGASATVVEACRSNLAQATRYSLSLILLVNGWAIVHYLLAAKYVRADLQRSESIVNK